MIDDRNGVASLRLRSPQRKWCSATDRDRISDRAGTVGVRVSWPEMGTTMRLFAEGVTVSGENELSVNVPVSTAREVVMFFGWGMKPSREHLAFTFETTIR